MAETIFCIVGFFLLCGFSLISIVISLILAGFKTKKDEEVAELDLKQQKKIE